MQDDRSNERGASAPASTAGLAPAGDDPRESEERFRAVADAAPALLWLAGLDRGCTYVNRGWLEFTGRELEDELGLGWLAGVHPEDRQRRLEAFHAAFERRESFAVDYRLRRADGEYRWVSDEGVPRHDRGGAFQGYVGVAVDVTVRKLMAARVEEASEQLRSLVEALPDAVVFKDATGRWQMANRAALALFGLEDVDWRNRSDEQLAALLPHARAGFLDQHAADEQAWLRRARYDSVDLFADRAGLPLYFEVSRVPLFRSSGERRGLVLLGRNAHERRLSEEALLLAASVFEQNREGIVITDRDQRILRVNGAFCEITGFSPEEVLGRTPRLLASGRHGPDFYAALWRSLDLTGQWQGEIWNRRKNGEVYPEWLRISAVRDGQGAVQRYVGSFSDVGERKRLEDERRHLALQDPLTGLPNRALVDETLRMELLRLARPDGRLALLLVDLDRFQRLNDALGYAVGDAVLVGLAERLRRWRAGQTLVGRWYGDEFALLVPVPHESELAVRDWLALLLTELRDVLERPLDVAGQSVRVTFSLGACLAPDDAADAQELVRCAETALRDAKSQGPGTCRLHTAEMDTAVRERIALEGELERALAQGELVLWFQPQFEVDSGRVLGAEALVRWNHPQRGLIQPGAFVPLAEATGAIVRLGQVVLGQACRSLARWRAQGLQLKRVSVNVSGRQLRPDFPAWVGETLAGSGLAARDLQLEITESALVEESPETRATLEELRRLGVLLSIDDFGTGYATFGYLKRFSVDGLKIDRRFVAGLPGDVGDVAIVRSMLSLAAGLGLRVVAEGVENLAQARFLALHGCHELQGQLYGRPLEAEAFEGFLRERMLST